MAYGNSLASKLAKQSRELPCIGYTVYWNIANIEVPRNKFIENVCEFNLPEDEVANVTHKAALRKALKALSAKRLIRQIDANDDRVVYAVVKEQINKRESDVNYDKESIVIYDKRNEYIRFKGSRIERLKDAFDRYMGVFTAQDIRSYLVRVIKHEALGITIRERGGIYYVTNRYADLIKNLSSLAESCGDNCYLHYFGLIDTEEAKKAIEIAFKEEFMDEVGFRTTKLQRFAEGKRAVSQSTIDSSDISFEHMGRKVKAIEDVTGKKYTEELQQINKLRSQFRSVVSKRGK